MGIVVFGEVLWDVKGSERRIGGAPFNFGAHLCRLGFRPQLVTAVGPDELGDAARAEAERLGLDPADLAATEHPTGSCLVTEDERGNPSYRLAQDVAYDFIPLPDRLPDPAGSLLYFGTLAQRAPFSARTLANLLSLPFSEAFCDINLRPPFYDRDILFRSLSGCTTLKVSREEYETLEDLGLLRVEDLSDYEHSFCRSVVKAFPRIRTVIVTLDKDGALVYDAAADVFCRSALPASAAVSAVGAGDSFSACFVASRLRGLPLQEAVDRAVLLSDFVVTKEGAVPDYPEELLAALTAPPAAR